jgi:multidrug efflux pump subunit AcrB/outer membrane protein TolC
MSAPPTPTRASAAPWNLFLRDRRLLVLVIGLIVVAGLSSLATITRQEDPTITNGIAVIVTPYPGASAERVESLVTNEVEDALRELSEVQLLSSVSRNGVSVVTAEIDERIQGRDTERVFSEIRDALDDARTGVPPGALPPIFDDERFGAYTLVTAIRWTSPEPARLGMLRRYAEELQDRLRDVPNTDVVRVFGAPEEEIRVGYDPDALAAAGLTPGHLARALDRADAKVAAGTVRSPANEMLLEVEGELDSLDRVRDVPVVTGGTGQELRIGDVAHVERAIADPPRELAVSGGQPAVYVAAQLAAGERFDRWTPRAMERLDGFRELLPDGMEATVVFDQSVYTRARLAGLVENLVQGLAIVLAVLFVSLGLRSALLVATALPLVALTSLATLQALGVPIHQMSVTGLIVALGLLVDNAIVVVDAVRAQRLAGVPSVNAVDASLRRLWVPLLASTLTTVLAFFPILLLAGRVGEFVGTIGLSVIVALVSSYFLAISVGAALAGLFLPATPADAGGERGWRGQGRRSITRGIALPGLRRRFEKSLDWSLRRPVSSMVLASAVPIAGFVGATTLPQQFFPPADRDQFHLELRMPETATIAETADATRRVDAVLAQISEVDRAHWTIGKSAPPFYYNLTQNQDGTPSYAQAQVDVRRAGDVPRLLPRIQDALDRAVPEAQILARELLQGPPVEAPIELRLYGPDLDELRSLGDAYRERMARVPQVTHTRATLTAGTPKAWLAVDEAEAGLAGLDLVAVAHALDARLEGIPAATVLEGTEEVPVRVRVREGDRRSLSDALSAPLVVPPARGTLPPPSAPVPAIPLSSVADVDVRPVLAGIPHRNGQRVNTVRGYLDAGVYPETATSALDAVLARDPVAMPPGYRVEVGGDAAERADAMGNLFASVPTLVLLMVTVIVLSLASFRLGAVIFAVAIQSVGLGLLSLAVLRYPLGFNAMIGLIGLIGVAINAAIIITSTLQDSPRAVAGDRHEIRSLVVGETSRHIVSTTITTFGGFLPLILAGGGFWPPFASGIAGGVLLSAIVSFYFVPQAFLLLTRRRTSKAPVPATAVAGAFLLALTLPAVTGPGAASAQDAPNAAEIAVDLDGLLARGGTPLDRRTVARRAVLVSPDLAAARARAQRAEAAWRVVRSALLPRTRAGVRYTRVSDIDNDPLVDTDALGLNALADLAREIDDPTTREVILAQLGGQEQLGDARISVPGNQLAFFAEASYPVSQVFTEILPSIRAAQDAADAEALAVEAARRDAALRAVETWLAHVLARGALGVAELAVRDARENVRRARARLAEGVGTRPDVLRFEARLAEDEALRASRWADVEATAEALRALLDLPRERMDGGGALPGFAAAKRVGAPSVESIPRAEQGVAGLIDDAWAARPELLALNRLVAAREHAVDAAGGARWPTLSVGANVEVGQPNSLYVPPNGDDVRTSWTAGAELSWSPDGTVRAQRERSRALADLDEIEAQREALRDGIRIEVARAWASHRAAFPRLEAARRQVAAATEAYDARRASWNQGVTSANEVLEAELDRNRARLALVDAGTALLRADTRLRHATGLPLVPDDGARR